MLLGGSSSKTVVSRGVRSLFSKNRPPTAVERRGRDVTISFHGLGPPLKVVQSKFMPHWQGFIADDDVQFPRIRRPVRRAAP